MPLEGLFFDLDGTLADTLPQLLRASVRTSEIMGFKVPDSETMRNYVGNGVWMILVRLIAGRREARREEVDEELLQRAREVYNRCYLEGLEHDYTIYPGVFETLQFCRERGIKLAIISNKPRMFTEPLVRFMQLEDKVDFVLGGEVLKERKPDPQPLLYVADQLKVNPQHCMMVGDSDNDILAGKNAGMLTMFIEGGYYTKDPALLQPDYIVKNYQELLERVKTLL